MAIKEIIATSVPRYDGPLKVTGLAKYTSDFNFVGMTYAVPVCSKIANGKILSIDTSKAKKVNGVIDVFTHDNIGTIFRVTPEPGFDFRVDEPRTPFEDNIIYYYGQFVAVVVAESFEAAQSAARLVDVKYQAEKPNVAKDLEQDDIKKVDAERGNASSAFNSSAVKVGQTYYTPVEVHNPIELHATVAIWENEKVTIYETSQAIASHRNVLAQMLGVPVGDVRVITRYLGSGFGGKLWAWPHSPMCAQVARLIKRPVKLVVDRHMEFTNVGHRARTEQIMKLSSDKNGKFTSLQHDYATQAGMYGDYKENCGEVSALLYNIPDVKVTSGVARRHQAVPTSMRGPGAVPGLFALESIIDELAASLKMDPVELRILNDTQMDLQNKKPFSSRHLKECLELGAKKFGWDKRNPVIGSMKDGDEILGWGVSGCTWHAARLDAEVFFEFKNDGKIKASCATHDIGTGMYTVFAEILKDETGLPFERMDIQIGDTDLPKGPLAGGSMATGSVIPAISAAVKKAVTNLILAATTSSASPHYGLKPADVKFEKGEVKSSKGNIAFGELLKKMKMGSVSGTGSVKAPERNKGETSTRSFGAQFVEIGWNPKIARLRVRKVVTVIDAGRIINYKPALNQIEGAIVMGIGMGLFEEAHYDPRDGNVVNSNLADYVMAVHADMPEIDVTFLDYPDKAVNDYGAKGVGEIGLAGVASSITSAVYHATGIRVRELPVTIEKLLADQA